MDQIQDIFSIISEFPSSPAPSKAPVCKPAAETPISEREDVHADFDLFAFFDEVDVSERQQREKEQQQALSAGIPVLLSASSKQSLWIQRGKYNYQQKRYFINR